MGHLLCFQVILSNGERLWPVSIFPVEDEMSPFMDLQLLHKLLNREGKVYVAVISYDSRGERLQGHQQVIAKDELRIIQGPIPFCPPNGLSVNEVFSLSEAARLWGIEGGGATIRKALERGDFVESEIRKSDGILLVTYSGMQRRYNAVKKDQWGDIHSYFVQEGMILEDREIRLRSNGESLLTMARRHRKAAEILDLHHHHRYYIGPNEFA